MPAGRPLLHAIGNAHIDPVWLWTWNEGLEEIRSTFRSALDLLAEYPGFVFTASSAAFYYLLEQVEPETIDKIRQRVREGRWEIAGGWWVEPDANIPCGESLVRQALYGQRYFQHTFGVRAEVGFNPDTFGHCAQIPQILRGAGQRYYAFLRPGPHEMDLPDPVFWWSSPAGDRVLASRIADSYATWAESPEEMEAHVQSAHRARPECVSDYTVFYGVGNHGGGPTRRNIEYLLARDGSEPAAEMSSLGRYFASLSEEIADGRTAKSVPHVTGPLQYHARGCYSAHSEIKRQNRRCEHLLMTAEKLAAMARTLVRRDYPREQLSEAWRLLLFNQFHDILAGTSIPAAYQDAREQMGRSASLASETIHFSLQSLARQVDTRGEGDALLVFNPLAWPVSTPVEGEPAGTALSRAEGGTVLAQEIQATSVTGPKRAVFVAELPALGWRVYRQNLPHAAAATGSEGMLEVTGTSLENEFFRVNVDAESGGIQRLLDKRHGVEVIGAPGIGAVVLDDPSDTWSHGVPGFRQEVGRFGAAHVIVEESGPVRAALRIESGWGASTMVQRLYLYRGLDFIECRVTLNWQEQYRALKLSFPFLLEEPQAVFETPYGFQLRDAAGDEEPGQQWVNVDGLARSGQSPIPYGVALLNDSKYGFDVLGSELRMTAVRSPAFAHHDPATLDAGRRYPHLDQGAQEFTWRLLPHKGAWQDAEVARRACELNVPPITLNEYRHEGRLPASASFAACDIPGVLLSVLKLAEDSEDLVVRACDASGRGARGRLSLPMAGVSWDAEFAPCQILTWRVRPGASGAVTPVDLLEEERP